MRSEVAFVTVGFKCEWNYGSAVIVYTSREKIMRKNPVKRAENEAPCVCTVFGLSANRVRKSVTKEQKDHECNSQALRATRHSAWPDAGTQRRQRIQQFGTSPLDSTDIADRGKQQCFMLSVHFLCVLCFSLSYILVCFVSPSSPLFSHMVLFFRPVSFNRLKGSRYENKASNMGFRTQTVTNPIPPWRMGEGSFKRAAAAYRITKHQFDIVWTVYHFAIYL